MSFCLGLLTVELHIPGSGSLKDRRAVVNALKDKIRRRFNVSLSEADGNELWQRAHLAAACVAATEGAVNKVLQDVLLTMDEDDRCEAFAPRIEYYA
jgi:uncharacterized protein YlxP (DUF503 family)